ncbi:MAG: IS4 family transposase [Rhodopirellula sp.]|nr:IS4 family transposase [Rhodopirellula sp.]
MGRKKRDRIEPAQIQGCKYFKLIPDLLERLHGQATERDRAGNREFFCDQYVSLLLLYFFSPIIRSLNGLQKATGLDKVQKLLGIKRVSMGTLSESAGVFDPEPLQEIIGELAARTVPVVSGREAEALAGLTAVDGSVLRALPRMAWALWQDDRHRGVKLHLHFDVLKAVPRCATVTPAACSESAELASTLEPNRLYVTDRGYQNYALFQKIINARSSFIARVKDNIAYDVLEERELGDAAKAAGVVRDVVLSRLGTDHHKNEIQQPVRLVVVQAVKENGEPYELWLITDRLDLDANLVTLGYRYRWTVELFFRWLKSILGMRHLISDHPHGVTMQLYAALIASLLMVLWTGLKPNKRTWEMLQFYRIPFEPYAPVRRQMLNIHRASNRPRKRASFSSVPIDVVPLGRRVVRPYA